MRQATNAKTVLSPVTRPNRWSGGASRNAESRIRRRITDGIVDFDLFLHHLERTDRRQIFEQATTDEAFVDGITAMLAFAYIGLKEQGIDFERVLVPAVRSAEEAYAVEQSATNVTVDVGFDVETTVNTTLEGIDDRIACGTGRERGLCGHRDRSRRRRNAKHITRSPREPVGMTEPVATCFDGPRGTVFVGAP